MTGSGFFAEIMIISGAVWCAGILDTYALGYLQILPGTQYFILYIWEQHYISMRTDIG